MSKLRTTLAALAAGALLAAAGAAVAADTEPAEIPEGILAKMARMNAKQGVDKGGRFREEGEEAGGGLRRRGSNAPACGSLNVGNVDTGGRRIGAPLREVTVVIRGDVINANNKCK